MATKHCSHAKRKQEYDQFLRSNQWQVLRQVVLCRDGYQCVYCQRPAKQVHHLHYRNWTDPSSMESVCQDCHYLIHNGKHSGFALFFFRVCRKQPLPNRLYPSSIYRAAQKAGFLV
jgi:hypothetical protein